MARKEINVFSLSFMDCICCGFGAVILLFVLSQGKDNPTVEPKDFKDLSGEVDKVEQLILDQKKNLVLAKNTIEKVEDETVETQGRSEQVITVIEEKEEEISTMDKETLAKKEHINKLKSDLKALDAGKRRLEGGSDSSSEGGDSIREFKGEGDRQYLTGVKVGGKRILILVDASASMLGEKLVDIIRRRNMKNSEKLRAAKWRQAVKTVEWITTQLPNDGEFQLYVYNETARSVLPEFDGKWISASDPLIIGKAVDALKKVIPENGTSHHQAFGVTKQLSPAPDNIFFLADSLPTMAEKPAVLRKTVSGKARLGYFNSARRILSNRTPINIILFPMEGDPYAASAFWVLAKDTKGSFFSPASDWP